MPGLVDCSNWNVFPGLDKLRPYNIVFSDKSFEHELAVGLYLALAEEWKPEKIVGACTFNGDVVYFMKWKHQDIISYISSVNMLELYSAITIKFFEKFNSDIISNDRTEVLESNEVHLKNCIP